MDGASRLLDLVNNVPGGLWTVLGILVGLTVALASFALTLWRYGGDIKKINANGSLGAFHSLNRRLDDAIGRLGEQSISIDSQSGKLDVTNQKVVDALAKLEDLLGRLNDDFAPRLNNLASKVAEASGHRVAAEYIGLARIEALARGESLPPIEPRAPRSATPPAADPSLQAEQLYGSMERKWGDLTALLKERAARTTMAWDGRAVGTMAYQLADRRRSERAIISLDLAEEIASLHGEWKSYIAAKASIRQWLTPALRNDFENRVGRAIEKLRD